MAMILGYGFSMAGKARKAMILGYWVSGSSQISWVIGLSESQELSPGLLGYLKDSRVWVLGYVT